MNVKVFSMSAPPLTTADVFSVPSCDDTSTHLCTGQLRYHHYCVDGFNDRGWGCGYRTVQTILSWIDSTRPPSIVELQEVLQRSGALIADQECNRSTAWIGVSEAVVLLDVLHDAAVEVLPIASGTEIAQHVSRLCHHFDRGGGPVMVGGGADVYSKTVIGIRWASRRGAENAELLILDPHYEGRGALDGDVAALRAGGWASWRPITSALSAGSFYNLALPRPLQAAHLARSVAFGESAVSGGERDFETHNTNIEAGTISSTAAFAGADTTWDIEVVEEGEVYAS